MKKGEHMVICGLKLTHDGAVCLIDNDKLIFNIEMEKLNNNRRHTSIDDLSIIESICKQYGYELSQIDMFAVDGWWDTAGDEEMRRKDVSIFSYKQHNSIYVSNAGQRHALNVGFYKEYDFDDHFTNALFEWDFDGLPINRNTYPYKSYMHVTSHIMSSYCTSPFAINNQDSYILVWDGGVKPQLYYIDAIKREIKSYGPIFQFVGNIYPIFSSFFEPYKADVERRLYDLSVAGKIMAYIALGEMVPDILDKLEQIYDKIKNRNIPNFEVYYSKRVASLLSQGNYRDQNILCTFHHFLECKLLQSLQEYTGQESCRNICITGGCGLNIKWNSSIRSSQMFDNVYVSPFPNDSGSAIGAACTALYMHSNQSAIQWDVYMGPHYISNEPAEGWRQKPCNIRELARLLHDTGEPIIVQNGRAELGPRALGNRSILAAPDRENMKDLLNKVKRRESYRPVSPICMEEHAQEIFKPGTPDPYMLFDHNVREEWKDKIPAVCHLDGSARLQTVNREQNALIYELLEQYEAISGIPLLCNTSANNLGKGFFPDIHSATKWGGTKYVWHNNVLYYWDAKD